MLFIFLEVISLVFVFNYNSFQRSKFLNSSNRISAGFYNSVSSVLQYFELGKVNEQLSAENARLHTLLQFSFPDTSDFTQSEAYRKLAEDSLFAFTPAKIINNSVNKQQNYLTLNKGRKDGVEPDQGIISTDGIVGVVTAVSESFSMGLSLLNPRWNVSAKLKESGFYGSLAWSGEDYQFADLLEIPFHVEIAVGDSVVTSGYSAIFPEGLMIGVIEDFSQPEGENYYKIKVRLSTNFKSIRHVEVIENRKKEELEQLENLMEDGQADR